jgi:ribosome biogenesis GTPase
MDGVLEYAKEGRTLAFIGSSGVGKSTLLNTLAGEEWAATQEIQEWSGKGRHTTTSRELVILPSGAMIIDTPGIREIGMIGEEDEVRIKGEASHRWRK